VPQVHPNQQRSRSFDSAGSDDSNTFLDIPKRFQRRRSSNSKTPPPCIHCQYVEEYERMVGIDQRYFIDHQEVKSLSYSETSSSSDDEDGDDEAETDEPMRFGNTLVPPTPLSPCNITFTLSPTSCDFPAFPSIVPGSPPAYPSTPPVFPPSPTIELPPPFDDTPAPQRTRRRSISRQEAIFVEPTGNSLENVANASDDDQARQQAPKHLQQQSTDSTSDDNELTIRDFAAHHAAADFVRDIYLAVPDLKRDRAASVDSCFSKVSSAGKTEELKPPEGDIMTLTLMVPTSGALRSRSVDIVLPTDEQARYKALALAGPTASSAHAARRYVFLLCINFHLK